MDDSVIIDPKGFIKILKKEMKKDGASKAEIETATNKLKSLPKNIYVPVCKDIYVFKPSLEKFDIEYKHNEIITKIGINIAKNGNEISSLIQTGLAGSSTVHDKAFVVIDNIHYLCICNSVTSISIPELTVNWIKKCDFASCFEIYSYQNELIVHGEVEIRRINTSGKSRFLV